MMPNGVHRKLYDLAGAEDDRRTSPYCWRIRFALAHKGLEYQCVPWRRVEKDLIAFSRQDLEHLPVHQVPVLVDDDTVVHDSWSIAEYLDKTYGDKPSLFGEAKGRKKTGMFLDKTCLHSNVPWW
ncbi:TPA: hypothetical protein ACH3X3_009440 [Trebouxia sp. C0006]